ncbi:amino acid adenylation domain-containing protein [Streptosporangium sp. NBC_01756]|uniref:amino acid adenylation domain-containing protein n=1 Tax=Streptosporangium sp. NBC_01756 TaxID=2975950 RepID=UPI002DDB440A|nr:amino acid adenylation domain-containing protein [Streptosporangium sp. NBC_01756]WSC85151.1 amino acid adenylation domain-containing protein [Streptosporangium sp. NBC_01756]
MIEDAYPLAALQAGMLYHSELEPGGPTYHDLMTVTLRGELDVAALTGALAEVTARHPVLRTSFDLTGFSEPLQLVHDTAVLPLQVADLRGDDALERLAGWREEEKLTPFVWSSPPLMRVYAHVLADDAFALSLSFHHAILDGWSVAALVTELLRRYTAPGGGDPAPPTARFRDLVAAERSAVASARAREFWRERVADAPQSRLPRLPGFPTGGPRAVEVLAVPVPQETVAVLERDSRELRVPLRTTLLAAHLRALSLVTGEREVMTGVLSHGRPESEGGGEVLGLFLNTLPVRVDVAAGSRAGLVRRVFEAEVAAVPYRHYPLFEIQRAAGRSPLLDTLFDFRDFHVYGGLPGEGSAITGQEFFEQTDLPCTVAFVRVPGGGLTLVVSYDRAEFPREQIETLTERVLDALTGEPVIGAAETETITRWNATGRDHPGGTLHGLVFAQAARTPDAPAVGFGGSWITYRELARRAAGIAAELRRAGVGPDQPVGVHLERSADLPVALLGVLAAGGAYLPLEPGHPAGRLESMLADAGASVLLTSAALADQAPRAPRVVLLPGAAVAADPPDGPEAEDALAYVIFTSGSTGRPKGVGISHRAIVNRLRWMQDAYGLTPADRVLHKTPVSFDVSVWELFWPLVTGAGLVVAEPGGHYEPGYLAELITTERITTAHFVPSMLDPFLDTPELAAGGLRRIVCSGEALPADLVRRFADRLPGVELHNLYGPTEAAVDVSWHRCDPAEQVVPIGRPVDNTRLEVLDDRLGRVPVGSPGQLFIGGVQLARGYLGRPALTAERFLPDPYGPPGSRLYATGDRARWRPDGELDYLGRLDTQVKIRGMRVEPGEIEAALLGQPEVRAAAVVARGDRLIGYVVTGDASVDWRARLRAGLPEHMIPSAWVTLDALPLTPNGKLDRAALPAPDQPGAGGYRVPPRDPVEGRLALIWEDVLGVTGVGAFDDFFDLGGHSLLALRLAMRVRQEFGRELPVAAVLAAPTVAGLADVLRAPEDMGAEERVVTLNAAGDRPPIVLVHALGGQVFRYLPMARRLGPDQPVYAVAASGLAPGEDPHRTMAEMVEDYVARLRALRPAGPYILGGFCIGGNIALEMARRLRALGEDVPLVALFYSDADEPVITSSLEDDASLMTHALAGGPLEADAAEFAGLDPEEMLLAVIDAAGRERRLAPDTADVEQARRYLRVFRANAHAVGRYRHDPYDGDVALFAPAGDRPDLGWGSVVKGALAIEPIPGERVVILFEPLVAEAAAKLRSWIDNGVTGG